MHCINLKTEFGHRFRVTKEIGTSNDPWNLELPCRHGHICPWGGNELAACTCRRGKLADRLEAAGARIVQNGDDGVNAVFHESRFAQIAKIMKPRRRKQISEAERRRLLAIGAARRFDFKSDGYK